MQGCYGGADFADLARILFCRKFNIESNSVLIYLLKNVKNLNHWIHVWRLFSTSSLKFNCLLFSRWYSSSCDLADSNNLIIMKQGMKEIYSYIISFEGIWCRNRLSVLGKIENRFEIILMSSFVCIKQTKITNKWQSSTIKVACSYTSQS